MATNYVQQGDVGDFTAPYDVVSGAGFKINYQFAIALGDALSGAAVRGQVVGTFNLLAVTLDTFSVGDRVYWDNSAKKATSTASGNSLIGIAWATKSSSATTVTVRINGGAI